MFADDTSLFSIVSDPLQTANILNEDLDKSRRWAEQWKMAFNSDPIKQAQEVVFPKRPRESFHPNLYLNKSVVEKVQTQKHLRLKLDKKLSFKERLKDKLAKVNRGIGILKKLSGFLPRNSLITLYKSLIRPHLDYADIIYDQPNNLTLCNKIETCQYNAAVAITGAIRGSSKERLCQDLGFEHLSSRRWLRKLCTFYKIVRNRSPGYLYKNILPGDRAYLTRNSNNIKQIFCRSEYFANYFFPIRLRSGINHVWKYVTASHIVYLKNLCSSL